MSCKHQGCRLQGINQFRHELYHALFGNPVSREELIEKLDEFWPPDKEYVNYFHCQHCNQQRVGIMFSSWKDLTGKGMEKYRCSTCGKVTFMEYEKGDSK